MRDWQNVRIVVVVFATILVLATQPPGFAVAADAVPKTQRDEDIASFRRWWYACAPPPSADAVGRITDWVREHRNDGEAVFFLAMAQRQNLEGIGWKPSEVKSENTVKMVRHAAGHGSLPAKARYAAMLLGFKGIESTGVTPEPPKGLKLLQEALDAGEPDAFMYRGLIFAQPAPGFEADLSKAEADLHRAIELGTARAWVAIALVRQAKGDKPGMMDALRKGAEAGDPQAQMNLSRLLLPDATTPADKAEAFRWMKKAAEGQRFAPDAHYALAKFYTDGTGTEVDHAAAVKWYAVASALGHEQAAVQLGHRRMRGIGCEIDPPRGQALLEELAGRGNADAQMALAREFIEGLVVTRDLDRARELLEAAAAQGRTDAAHYLRLVEYHGRKGQEKAKTESGTGSRDGTPRR